MSRRKRSSPPPDLSHISEQLRPLAAPIESLTLDPRNARRHPETNLAALTESLRLYGQRRPVVVRREGMVVEAGHGLIEAARRLGWTHVAALLVDDDATTATGYALADNRTAELAEWDDGLLAELLGELREVEVDLGALGWDTSELDRLLAEPVDPPTSDPQGSPVEDAEEDQNPNDDLVDGEGPPPPFPWFGGKRRVAGTVWKALGDVALYVEPFAGSLAVLLGRPADHQARLATVNDLDAYVANFWRAVHGAPEEVAAHADWPVNETDLFARHAWLVNEGRARIAALEADPEHFDAKVAGWWVWGLCSWIGRGWCSGKGVSRQLPHLGDAGRGVSRQRPHLGTAGQGVNRQSSGTCEERRAYLASYMRDLCERLREVRVCCGDWSRVVTDGATAHGNPVGVFLDPPYLTEVRCSKLYNQDDSATLAHEVRAWALSKGDDPRYRIVLAGYEPEHEAHMPASWRRIAWRAKRAYGNASSADTGNRHLERLWLSPHCL